MVRSQWLGAVVVGLAWTGSTWSQAPAVPPARHPVERFVRQGVRRAHDILNTAVA